MGGDPRDPPLGTGVGLASLAPELRKRPHHASSHRISSCYHFISFHLISFQFFSSHHISSHRMTPDIRQKCSQEQYLIRVCTFLATWEAKGIISALGRPFGQSRMCLKPLVFKRCFYQKCLQEPYQIHVCTCLVTWDDFSALGREAKSIMCLKPHVSNVL